MNVDFKLPSARKYFKDGDSLHVGNITLKVIETPGHTPGGVNFYSKADGVLFSGDNLFRREIGRCDLPGGNEQSLISTLRGKVLTLPGEVVVYPGHGANVQYLFTLKLNSQHRFLLNNETRFIYNIVANMFQRFYDLCLVWSS